MLKWKEFLKRYTVLRTILLIVDLTVSRYTCLDELFMLPLSNWEDISRI